MINQLWKLSKSLKCRYSITPKIAKVTSPCSPYTFRVPWHIWINPLLRIYKKLHVNLVSLSCILTVVYKSHPKCHLFFTPESTFAIHHSLCYIVTVRIAPRTSTVHWGNLWLRSLSHALEYSCLFGAYKFQHSVWVISRTVNSTI